MVGKRYNIRYIILSVTGISINPVKDINIYSLMRGRIG